MGHRKYTLIHSLFRIALISLLLLWLGLIISQNTFAADQQSVLKVVGWDAYTAPDNNRKTIGYRQFEKKFGVSIEFTPLSNLDEIIDAVESNQGYDIIIVSNEGLQMLRQMKLVSSLDPEKITHYSNLLPQLKRNQWIENNNRLYAVPWAWGPTGLLYNTRLIDEPDSWNILWDPDYAGQVALWDDVSMIWVTALSLGYNNVYNLTREQLEQVKQKLFKLNTLSNRYYYGKEKAINDIHYNNVNLLNSWFNPSAKLRSKGHSFKMVIPREGTVGSFDSLVVQATSKNKQLAHQYINHQISPEVQVQMSRITGLSPANKSTGKLLSKDEIKSLHLYDEDYFNHMLLRDVMPRKQLYDQVLAEVREDTKRQSLINSRLPLTTDELEWILKHPVVSFTGDPNWLPFEAFTDKGEYIGIVSEHLKLISESTGLRFSFKPTKTWTESITLAKQEKVDILSETDDSDMSSYLDFTNPYVSNPIVIAMLNKHNFVESIDDINDLKIALIKDYGYASKIRRKYKNISFHTVDDIHSGLIAVSTGEVDALLCTLALCSYTIAELGLNNVKITGKTEFDTKLAFGVQKNLPVLTSILNKALSNISREQQQAIFDKWIKEKYTEKTDFTLIILVIIGAIILISIFAFWNLRLSHEIALRKSTERERKKTEARFEAMFESLPDAIIYAGADRKIKLLNKPAEKLFGYTLPELEGQKTRDLYASEKDYDDQGAKRYNGKTDFTSTPYTVTYKKKNGELFEGETLSTTVRSSDGELIGYLAIIRDISERSHVEEILRSMAASSSALEFDEFLKDILLRLSKLYNCKYAFIGLLQPDRTSVITVSVMSDYEVVENFEYLLEGTPCKDIMNLDVELIPRNAASLYPNDEMLIQMGVESYFGAPLVSSDNKVIGLISVMDTAPLIIDQWTEPVLGVFSTRVALELERNQAIEELQKHREQLEEQVKVRTADLIKARDDAERANASKSKFLSRMSHELRTPMNAILGFGQILEHNANNNLSEVELSYVDEVLKGGYHLLELINEVLDLSRVESGQLQYTREDFNLNETCQEATSLVMPMADSAHINIVSKLNDQQICVNSDRTRIKQILLNLLSNAVKYNKPGGMVEIHTEKSDSFYKLHVRDTGNGIPESIHSRVFEPFDRLNVNTSEIEGTGIGLSLSKKMIEMMGGSIGFSSQEDIGSDFWIQIPRSKNTPKIINKTVKPVKKEAATKGKFTILYVEDNPANLRLVWQLFNERGGIKLHDAHTASIAFDLLSSRHFDLILLDIHLPGDDDGYDILKKIRSNPDLKEIPVIAISANATEHDIKQGIEAGFDEYITKPINVSKFLTTIDAFLSDIKKNAS